MENPNIENYSLPLKVYAAIVGKETGDVMKSNRDNLKSADQETVRKLIDTLGDEEFITGFNPKFLHQNQLKKFEKMINKGQFDRAVNYVQTFSGEVGQRVLNDLLSPTKDVHGPSHGKPV